MQARTRFIGVLLSLVVLLVGTSSVFAQVQLTDCMECHNDTTVITDKQTAMSESMHGTGESYGRGTRNSCAGCHSGGAFSKMAAAGLRPDQVEEGDPNPTRQDCRACHQIHTSYTTADWALETVDPVTLYAFEGVTYDGGKGNLCANCHQPRRAIAAPDADGNIAVTSTHWGPHHGPQSAMLLGVGGASAAGDASLHGTFVADGCVTCHVGENDSHTFEAVDASCLECHAEDFDTEGFQDEIQELIDQLGELLVAKGLLDEEGHPVVGTYPAAEASALWDYIFIVIEDGSRGVHNPAYTRDLLEAAIAALQ
ncbi:MAG: hypothetical protein JSW27_12115 [Phycisphaerales bacterium]|nr:MAG: hypothetical protein JSW27_12115 [Phycisphaerales bacterium]